MNTAPVPINRGTERRRSSTTIRRISFCKVDTVGNKRSLDLLTGLPQDGPKVSIPEAAWNPKEATSKNLNRSSSKNLIDGRSLYSIRRENIASRDMSFINGPINPNDGPASNIEHLIEKNYIVNSQLSNATPEKFPRVIMSQFHRVSGSPNSMSYGMPRPPSRDKFQEVVEGIKREPSIVRIKEYPSLQEPVHCTTLDEFCEILGPSACNTCIENTNRFIGEQLQDMVFPTIDITADKLIAPKLAKLFRDGHRSQVRKKRIRELGFEFPEDLMTLTRSETHLSDSTCHRCKKPLKVPTLKVSAPYGRLDISRNERLYARTKDLRTSRF
ncbi:uncharacterized protein LOC132749192 isoform X2 [Ruditapes philippinarum]|nr:uncharacterized protein LOC132749192 isoform X2 [Ruditapes philippinarum]